DLLLKLSFNNPFIVSLLKKFDYANSKLLLRSSLAGKNENFQAAESMLDQAYYLELKESATKTASKLIKQFIAATIDLANLKNTLRLALTTKDKKTLKESIIKGGMISRELWLDLFYKQPQEIQTRLRFSLYFPYLNEGIESLIKTGSLVKLEKLADDFLVNQFHRAKYLGSGLEPLVGFFLAKEVEIKTLRFILTCKKQKVNAEKIKERIRINY
ncbi:MAG: V-type ATPase subunit, partial [Candidatus Saganbacteria bacterium]|nr:V-type ATPase subunit [Candidatus Saganbacteria bacterium]